MEMEMQMRAMEDIDIATDITPPLTPLAFSLHNSNLQTHCSACFSLLPPSPIVNSNSPSPFLYCSPPCSTAHRRILLHYHHPAAASSDLRTALQLLISHHPSRSGRIAGLLSNHHKLTWQKSYDEEDEVTERINIGAGSLAVAIAEHRGEMDHDGAVLEEAAAALCAVLTNAVEVQDKEGRALGIAVYGPTFSWIDHSCSPNACYRFIPTSPSSSSPLSEDPNLRIAPFPRDSGESAIDGGFCATSTSEFAKEEGMVGYGPRLIVRSIKRIKKGDEVTVAYTDLLQPKAMRQLDLLSKYRFICCCKRCSALPFTYVDLALQEISVSSLDTSGSCSDYKVFRDVADRKLADYVDDVILEYLTVGDPESCCEKLERILMQGLSKQLDNIEEKSHYKFTLNPLHYLSLNAYTTLASAYKVRAGDFLSAPSEIDRNQLEAFDMSRTSAAYYLLLAGATHHLFNSDPSLIASVANFWMGAGESLLLLARSSEWRKFVTLGRVVSNLSSATNLKCSRCSLMDRFRASLSNGQITDFENVSDEVLHCISDVTQKIWSFLIYGCHFLRSFKDPTDFNWLKSSNNSNTGTCNSFESKNSFHICEEQAHSNNAREDIFHLGVHCLAYGGLLASICYGHHSHLACYVQNILDHEEKNIK